MTSSPAYGFYGEDAALPPPPARGGWPTLGHGSGPLAAGPSRRPGARFSTARSRPVSAAPPDERPEASPLAVPLGCTSVPLHWAAPRAPRPPRERIWVLPVGWPTWARDIQSA